MKPAQPTKRGAATTESRALNRSSAQPAGGLETAAQWKITMSTQFLSTVHWSASSKWWTKSTREAQLAAACIPSRWSRTLAVFWTQPLQERSTMKFPWWDGALRMEWSTGLWGTVGGSLGEKWATSESSEGKTRSTSRRRAPTESQSTPGPMMCSTTSPRRLSRRKKWARRTCSFPRKTSKRESLATSRRMKALSQWLRLPSLLNTLKTLMFRPPLIGETSVGSTTAVGAKTSTFLSIADRAGPRDPLQLWPTDSTSRWRPSTRTLCRCKWWSTAMRAVIAMVVILWVSTGTPMNAEFHTKPASNTLQGTQQSNPVQISKFATLASPHPLRNHRESAQETAMLLRTTQGTMSANTAKSRESRTWRRKSTQEDPFRTNFPFF